MEFVTLRLTTASFGTRTWEPHLDHPVLVQHVLDAQHGGRDSVRVPVQPKDRGSKEGLRKQYCTRTANSTVRVPVQAEQGGSKEGLRKTKTSRTSQGACKQDGSIAAETAYAYSCRRSTRGTRRYSQRLTFRGVVYKQ